MSKRVSPEFSPRNKDKSVLEKSALWLLGFVSCLLAFNASSFLFLGEDCFPRDKGNKGQALGMLSEMEVGEHHVRACEGYGRNLTQGPRLRPVNQFTSKTN